MSRFAQHFSELLFRVRGVRYSRAWIVDRLRDRQLDRELGLESSDRRSLRELGIDLPESVDYQPVSYSDFRVILNSITVTPDDVFLDLGCGMGRAVCLAAFYPFRSIIGVEISPELCSIAKENIARIRNRLRCSDIEIVNANANAYDIPPEVSVVFFFNPFGGAIMSAVLGRVAESARQRPRSLRLLFYGTAAATVFRKEAERYRWLRFCTELKLPTGAAALIYEVNGASV
ncbi:MAG: class I SAM-dependent methyltransferase [Acidobacteriaceae bacterium]|nr:class I SAM-dependent methyltransferase [Acidobacteriaceae bacterium]MBV8569198.1 class I SAM-dependent methyltransferase [Acidobacteriaceae bacterium]